MRLLEVLDGTQHLAWAHMKWLEGFATVGAGPYAAMHPNPRQERPTWRVPCTVASVRVSGRVRRCRTPNNSWLVFPVNVSGLARGKMPVFSSPQAI